MLSGKCVVLGVSGGIAAYKSLELVSRLRKMNARVRVVMTENACRFVAPLSFETLSANAVSVSGFERAFEIEHIALAKEADLFLIAPATGNILGKIACGIADDLLSTAAMAVSCPALLAPAMNSAMWRSPAVAENVKTLTRRGFSFIGPASGRLACGEDDVGRMSEPEAIAEAAARLLLRRSDLAGKRILVTAGPTRERLDPVRFLSNRSSGKMGYAIAAAARDRGAEVLLVSGPVSLDAPAGVKRISIESTRELFEAVTENAPKADAVIQAAAPADYRAETVSPVKIKKSGDGLSLSLVSTPDIAKHLGERKRAGQVLVAFAAETNDCAANARKKLFSKNADFVVLNDVTEPGAGFAVDTNRATIIGRDGEEALPLLSKRRLADEILNRVLAAWETA